MITKNLFFNIINITIPIPKDIKNNILSFTVYNKDWNIIIIDSLYIKKDIDLEILVNNTNHLLQDDIIMLYLLNKYGGVWCNYNIFNYTNLNLWITNNTKNGLLLLKYKKISETGIKVYLDTNFLYSEKDNYMIKQLMNKITCDDIKKSKKIRINSIFNNLYQSNDKFKKIINDAISDNSLKKNIPIVNCDYISKNNIFNIDNKFIHIGKTGGTYLTKHIDFDGQYHLRKPIFNRNEFYVIWLRNPIDRYVSAFWYVYDIINIDLKKININNLNLDNCISPEHIRKKKVRGYAFDKSYESLINFFKSPNHLAESLSSENKYVKHKAYLTMTHHCEHIGKGIGYYLSNGKFIESYHKNILFVGTMENIIEDINTLSKLLNVSLHKSENKIRNNDNNNDKILSKLAIKNIIKFYTNTDYKALQILMKYKFINQALYDKYYTYTYIKDT